MKIFACAIPFSIQEGYTIVSANYFLNIWVEMNIAMLLIGILIKCASGVLGIVRRATQSQIECIAPSFNRELQNSPSFQAWSPPQRTTYLTELKSLVLARFQNHHTINLAQPFGNSKRKCNQCANCHNRGGLHRSPTEVVGDKPLHARDKPSDEGAPPCGATPNDMVKLLLRQFLA